MAKQSSSKKRRQHRPNIPAASRVPVEQAQAEPVEPAVEATGQTQPAVKTVKPAAKTTPAAAGATAYVKVDFAKEYSYVVKDLRSMAIISAVMVVLLIALNFLIL